jgi:outer membrane protein assembly factor BamA
MRSQFAQIPAFALAALVATSAAAWAQSGPGIHRCEDLPIQEIRVDGCDEGRCELFRERLDQIVGTSMGRDRFRTRDFETTIERLEGVGAFASVTGACTRTDAKATVVFTGAPSSVIRELSITGNEHFYLEDIKRRVFLRPGTLIAPEIAEGVAQIARQRETLEHLYERAGLVDTEVGVRTEEIGNGELRLLIEIREGHVKRIHRIDIHTQLNVESKATPEQSLSQKKNHLVCPRFSESTLRRAISGETLDVFTDRTARQIQNDLRTFLQMHGIQSPQITVEHIDEEQRIDVQITFARCHLIQFHARDDDAPDDRGFRRVRGDEWRALLPFEQSGSFDFEEAELGRQILQADLENGGHLLGSVAVERRTVRPWSDAATEESLASDQVLSVISYFVTRGYVYEVRRIEFPGANHFSNREIRDRIGSQPYNFFGVGGYLQSDLMFADLLTVKRMHADAGYHQMRFTGFEPTAVDTVIREALPDHDILHFIRGELGFRVRQPHGEHVLYVEASVDAGPRSHITSVDITGCDPDHCPEVLSASGIKAGDPFSPGDILEGKDRIRSSYQDRGHASVDVSIQCHGEAPAVDWERCDIGRLKSKEVAIRFRVQPGPLVRIGPIFLVGNFKTDSEILFRDLPESGDVLILREIRESERRLRNLGIFNTVRIQPVGIHPNVRVQEVPLFISIEEKGTQFIDFAIGFESINRSSDVGEMPTAVSDGIQNSVNLADSAQGTQGNLVPFEVPDLLFVFQTEYLNRNLAGTARELRVPFKYGLSTTDAVRLVAVAPTLIDRRFLGSELHFRNTVYGLYDKARNPFDLLDGGMEMELSQSLTDSLYLSMRYAISANSVRELETDADFGSPTLLNKLTSNLSWQEVDAATHPTEGFGVLGNVSYINSIDLDSEAATNFIKYEISLRGFFNLKRKIVFANLFRFGGSYSIEGENLPEIERFRLGGSKGLRGFEDGEVAQYDGSGDLIDGDPSTPGIERIDAGDFVLTGTHEIRFPFFLKLGPVEFWGAGFFDWGSLADSLKALRESPLRTSAGIGLRLLIYGRVPIRLDYGWKLNRRCHTLTNDGTACAIQETPGELDFNLLYTF